MAIVRRIVSSHTEPIDFERPFSKAYWLSKRWNRELPTSVRLSIDVLPTLNRTLDPEVIEQASRAVLEKMCEHQGMKATIDISPHRTHKKQVTGFIVYTDSICDRALETLSNSRARQQPEIIAHAEEAIPTVQPVLQDLEAMLEEQDEPDFKNRPTGYAYNIARQTIEGAYTHYIGSAPLPTLAPDGEGGIIAEWKSGRRIVRLIVSASQAGKSYVYSRGISRSLVDYSVSDLILAQQLHSIFAD